MITSTFRTELLGSKVIFNHSHVMIPFAEVHTWKEAGVKRVNGTINNIPFRLALISDGEGGLYLMLNKALCKKANMQIGDQVNVTITEDLDPDRIDFAEEFLEVLAQDEEASAKFFAFTLGKQRSLNVYITQAKGVETRLKRSFELADKIKRNALGGEKKG